VSRVDGGGEPRAVACDERGPVAVVRLQRPAERNPLSVSTLAELESLFTSLAARSDLRAVVFTGAGLVFASGADIRELASLTPAEARAFAARGQNFFHRISTARPLTVAAVNGFCFGGGLDLALSCRLRVAARRAVFAHPGARLGIITGWGGTQRLPRLVGEARALEMFTTGRRLSAAEALEWGLVSGVADDALELALKLAEANPADWG
jgi:enoyl-CoA hydratase